MRKAYLLVFNTAYASREKLIEALDQCRTVITWRYDLSHAIYIISENSAHEIATELEMHTGTGPGRYLILEYTGNSQGRLTGESWHLLNEKYHKPKA